MRKLHICLTALGCYPDVKDGAAFNIRGIFDGLRKRGHHVTLYTGLWNSELNVPGIQQFQIARKRFFWFPQYIEQIAHKLLTNHFDVIHSNGSRSTLPIHVTNKKYVTTIHDLGPFETPFTRIPIVPLLERLNANRAVRIATVSNSNKDGIRYYLGEKNAEKTRVILSAIDPAFSPQPSQAQVIRERLRLKGPVLLYVGRIAFYKGVEDIIKAYNLARKEVPDLNLIVGGMPELKMRATYQEWKNKYADVKFTGMIPQEELPAYYSMANAFVTYSFASEGFGLTPIEAIACGTPVICSNLAAYKEVLQNHAIFVPPRNPETLARTFVDFLKNEEQRKQLVKDSHYLRDLYSWNTVIDRVEKIYEELV